MPTYEYRCSNCGEELETFQKMSDEPLAECPKCKKETLQRIVSGGAGVLYKGEGWYVTDYSKKSTGGKEAPVGTNAPSSTTQKRLPETSAGDKPSTEAIVKLPSPPKAPAKE